MVTKKGAERFLVVEDRDEALIADEADDGTWTVICRCDDVRVAALIVRMLNKANPEW